MFPATSLTGTGISPPPGLPTETTELNSAPFPFVVSLGLCAFGVVPLVEAPLTGSTTKLQRSYTERRSHLDKWKVEERVEKKRPAYQVDTAMAEIQGSFSEPGLMAPAGQAP